MITTEALRGWLAGSLPAVHWVVGPDLPDKPDRAAAVTRGPGGNVTNEGILDRGTFTVRMRGLPTKSDMPELDLHELRGYVERFAFPHEVGEHAIVSCWSNGPPYPLPGPDNGRRYEFVQTFIVLVSNDF